RPDKWELESTKSQLIRLGQVLLNVKKDEAYLQNEMYARDKADQSQENEGDKFADDLHHFLETVLGIDSKSAQKILSGKIGLGLSGGGFRAALYHIGVLAKMAEFDLLKDVEVISCVSGGS